MRGEVILLIIENSIKMYRRNSTFLWISLTGEVFSEMRIGAAPKGKVCF